MYCRKCGNKMEEGDRFCGKCGADQAEKVEKVETVEAEPVEVLEAVEAKPVVDTKAVQAGANDFVKKAKELLDKGITYVKGMERNHQIIAGVLVAVLLMFFVSAIYGGALSGGGKNKTPEAAVKSMFTSIYKGDAKGLLKVIPPNDLYDIREEAGFDDEAIYEMMEYGMTGISNEMSAALGKDWLKKIEILGTRQYSDSEFGVNVGMYGGSTEIYVYKIDGKYYVDLDSMY